MADAMDAKPNAGKRLEELDGRLEDGCEDLAEGTTVLETSIPPRSLTSCETEAQELDVQNRTGTGPGVQALRLSITSSSSVALPSATDANQSLTSDEESQEQMKTKASTVKPLDEDDLCAAILLACLFCHPLDCLLATVSGCNRCVWSLCSMLFCCESTALRPLSDIARHCGVCWCRDLCCSHCDCSICDLCLQATECLDLAMEISQMLYH
ncbi:myoD family inhibitor domain-containing protein 2 [Dunckerocampus dactyliophorus]|uniref:myoD family inhibitor domain-containing protein 2 n=1 Tax=Dunckerocampus dactyliophorus TaxID=161453 RepID=UPI0024053CA6|nr:myoD family inhibitor domain-containing protein 2 [Dunckerocampus dactyliophorus]XP_054641629.1 myoD family inhibitor domain-containing protein 2 [Dunckerocampus dactyliophorus]XP_054641630.1 myoD family inhibitor domain-containing protein 2 [Dunckerocampus dactyliophorus]